MFEDATFHSRSFARSQTPKWMAFTCAANLTLLAALTLYPLLNPQSLPARLIHLPIYIPAPAPEPIPQIPTQTQSQTQTSSAPTPTQQIQSTPNPLQTPTLIPTGRDPVDPGPVPIFDAGTLGSPNGSAVGQPATSVFRGSSPAPAVRQATPTKTTLSQGVTTGLLLSSPQPLYPPIARTVGVSGTVVLAATISTSGTIENLHVLSGHPMLQRAAIEAVQNWRYRPYRLNNQPVEVETTISVVFSIASR